MSYSQCPKIIRIEFVFVFLREKGWREVIQLSKSLFKAFARKSTKRETSGSSSLESGRSVLQSLWVERYVCR